MNGGDSNTHRNNFHAGHGRAQDFLFWGRGWWWDVIRRHDEPARPAIEAWPYAEGLEALQIGEIAFEIGRDLIVVFQDMPVAVKDFKSVYCHLSLPYSFGCYWIDSRPL